MQKPVQQKEVIMQVSTQEDTMGSRSKRYTESPGATRSWGLVPTAVHLPLSGDRVCPFL